tara:strand:- start:1359 stop:2237 length:879 start_codon:yes stop_codon:yes gene_type:complete
MYYYKDSSKNIIYVKSKESLINLISQNIISENTEIRIGLRGTFIEAKEIEDLKDLFHNDEKYVGDFNLNDEKIENQEEFLEQDKLTEIDDETLDNDLNIENYEEGSIQDNVESSWNNEMSDEVEVEIKTQEEEVIEKENIVEDLSEQEHQQDSEYEEEEPIDDTEAHASAYVSFPTAVKLAFKNYFNFSDRSSRSEYWFFVLFVILLEIASIFLVTILPPDTSVIITIVLYILYIIPSISVAVRRLHDIDMRGWWILISVIPIIGWVFLVIMHSREGNIKENRFGVKTLGAE